MMDVSSDSEGDDESDNELIVPSFSSCFVNGDVDELRFLQRRRMLNRRATYNDDDDTTMTMIRRQRYNDDNNTTTTIFCYINM